jgi:transposase
MKDGRTHLVHKAEHAVDLDTGALIAVTLQDADQGDTTTLINTVIAAAEQVEAAHAVTDEPEALQEIVVVSVFWTRFSGRSHSATLSESSRQIDAASVNAAFCHG